MRVVFPLDGSELVVVRAEKGLLPVQFISRGLE